MAGKTEWAGAHARSTDLPGWSDCPHELGASGQARAVGQKMFLNQCLAISLARLGSEGGPESASRESAPTLFRQLIEENQRKSEDDKTEGEPEQERSRGQQAEEGLEDRTSLNEALARLNFAGFVLPAWLLVSGSLEDLGRVRSSWFEGRLRAPPGFRLETIGEY